MKRREFIQMSAVLAAAGASTVLTGCSPAAASSAAGPTEEEKAVRLCVDGARFRDADALAAAFNKAHPEIECTVERLPSVTMVQGTDGQWGVNSDELEARTAAMQQHRTAIMAGSAGADLYLLGGGLSQFSEYNGGAFIANPSTLLTAGVLADMAGVFQGCEDEFLQPALAAGQWDGQQLLVPLGITVNGFLRNAEADLGFDPTEAGDTLAFVQTLQQHLPEQIGYLAGNCTHPFSGAALPPSDKTAGVIWLTEPEYEPLTRSVELLQAAGSAIPADRTDYAARLQRGDAILNVCGEAIPAYLSSVGGSLLSVGASGQVAFEPLPNENGGVTASVALYAAVPQNSPHKQNAAAFLQWLLSQPVQANDPDATGSQTGILGSQVLPVRKNCMAVCTQRVVNETLMTPLGQACPDSLTALETRISAARFLSEYDYRLLLAVQSWAANGGDLTADYLQPLADEWALYLDE